MNRFLLTRLCVAFLIFIQPFLLQSQLKDDSKVLRRSSFYSFYSAKVGIIRDTVQLSSEITSLSISIPLEDNFKNAFVLAENDTFPLVEDKHSDSDSNVKFSQLIIFERPVRQFILFTDNIKGKITYHFINSGETPNVLTKSNNRKLNKLCGKPRTVDQSEWREGLKAPSYTPSYTNVKHLIVHHSAGSNTNLDFTYVVRQIYLYHTEVRNYSDIAYNFLIAQDGTIFEGRQGSGDNEENATGAHFCAKNSGTMGVCLLGNYETAQPSAPMLSALEQLLGWKLAKENLDPFASFPHPGESGSALGVIAGHQDGCSTECPGKNVYSKLNEIRQRAGEAKKNMNSTIPTPLIVSNERQGPGRTTLQVSGASEGSYVWFSSQNLEDSIPGERGAQYVTPSLTTTTSFYVAIKSGGCMSSLLRIDAIIKPEDFLVYPNPTDGEVTVVLNSSFRPDYFSITTATGQKIIAVEPKVKSNAISFDVSSLSDGLYILRLKSANHTVTRRLIIRR